LLRIMTHAGSGLADAGSIPAASTKQQPRKGLFYIISN
jgi:hypothetical protein